MASIDLCSYDGILACKRRRIKCTCTAWSLAHALPPFAACACRYKDQSLPPERQAVTPIPETTQCVDSLICSDTQH